MTDYTSIKSAIKSAIPEGVTEKCRKEIINAMKNVLKTHYPRPTNEVPNPEPLKPKRGRPRKYFTEEERLEAIRRQKREYKQRQKAKKLLELEEQQKLTNDESTKLTDPSTSGNQDKGVTNV